MNKSGTILQKMIKNINKKSLPMGLANIVKMIRFCSLFYRMNENFRVKLGTDLDNRWNYVCTQP